MAAVCNSRIGSCKLLLDEVNMRLHLESVEKEDDEDIGMVCVCVYAYKKPNSFTAPPSQSRDSD